MFNVVATRNNQQVIPFVHWLDVLARSGRKQIIERAEFSVSVMT